MFKQALALLGLTMSLGANAALIDNGGSTTDTATGLTWLDLTATQGQSISNVLAGYGGYVGSGWTVATTSQVCGLFGALGDATPNCGNPAAPGFFVAALAPANATTLVSLLGQTSSTGAGSYGMFDDSGVGSNSVNFGLGCVETLSGDCSAGNSWTTSIDWGTQSSVVGTFLVNSSIVPIPAAAWLFGSALLGLGAMKRWKS